MTLSSISVTKLMPCLESRLSWFTKKSLNRTLMNLQTSCMDLLQFTTVPKLTFSLRPMILTTRNFCSKPSLFSLTRYWNVQASLKYHKAIRLILLKLERYFERRKKTWKLHSSVISPKAYMRRFSLCLKTFQIHLCTMKLIICARPTEYGANTSQQKTRPLKCERSSNRLRPESSSLKKNSDEGLIRSSKLMAMSVSLNLVVI